MKITDWRRNEYYVYYYYYYYYCYYYYYYYYSSSYYLMSALPAQTSAPRRADARSVGRETTSVLCGVNAER